MPAPLTATAQHNQQQQLSLPPRGPPPKNVKRKSSKPIINWLQRKLAGTVRTRRPSDPGRAAAAHARGAAAAAAAAAADGPYPGRAPTLKELQAAMLAGRAPAPRDISLNSTNGATDDDYDGESTRRSSGAAFSMWGARSNPLEADEDASIRPLPPTSPPSPSPSRSSSSYMSDPRTFKSMSASTKPTTLLSIDLTPTGMAHIAQAPPTPTTSISAYNTPGPSPIARFPPHVRTSSNSPAGPTSLITFSALPPSSPPSSRPSSLGPAVRAGVGALQAPAHTSHHPRNNPRPSSPPLDNASVLTLASSAFAAPHADRGRGAVQAPYQYSWAGGDSASHLSHLGGDSFSHIMLDGELAAEEQNASVRALRPRSSRRDSWESEVSRWSAGVSVLGNLAAGRERSVRTAPSFRTGGHGTLDVDDTVSVSLIDEDMVSTREEGVDEVDETEEGTNDDGDDRDRALSPMSAGSVEEAAAEGRARVSEATEVGGHSPKDSDNERDLDEAATPGAAGRTLELAPLDTPPPMPVPASHPQETREPSTPRASVAGRETETTPKKGKRGVAL
ncbi:hypothetical protein DFH11DRAFT_1857087 [Phellopilus nigrolimitatus]|nr:hypothetical protein DFH11DRAFT_1857087 [Phellopilus nigrolimitatus]